MSDSPQGVSRRTVLKGAAASGLGLVAGGSAFGASQGDTGSTSVTPLNVNADWFSQRVWSMSGNKVVLTADGKSFPAADFAKRVYRPRSAAEIAEVVKATPATTPIACVCGGHEAGNSAVFTGNDAVLLDMSLFKSIEFHQDDKGMLVTVGGGVVFQELVEAVKANHGALPVGTGAGVGAVGYIVNGGLSGYFSRRLGLLGQRVEKLTMVTAAGDIRVLTQADELLTAMMGAGSALGIVVDVTIRVAPESVIQSAEQRVVVFETRKQAVEFSRGALRILRDNVLPNESVSMELVVTGSKALVSTFTFFDSFKGNAAEFVKPIEELAASLKLPVVASAHWSSWYEAASALWPIIAEQKGDPLATMYHCVGTKGTPDDRTLDFASDTIVGEAPLDEAAMSLVELRTLGGAAKSGKKLPSGNCHHEFFVDLVTLYDAGKKSVAERQAIVELTQRVMDKARAVDGLAVEFSGTHTQPDDVGRSAEPSVIFGTPAMAESVKAQKRKMDPDNRFRFHPFAKFL